MFCTHAYKNSSGHFSVTSVTFELRMYLTNHGNPGNTFFVNLSPQYSFCTGTSPWRHQTMRINNMYLPYMAT